MTNTDEIIYTTMDDATDSLELLTKEELVEKVIKLSAHVKQLQNILKKSTTKPSAKRPKQRPFDFTKFNTRHVALLVLYLGWDYNGFVVQEDSSRTIEHELFEALLKTKLIESRQASNYHRCGRTDKGVSALSQVISIDLRSNLSEGQGVKVRDGAADSVPGMKLRTEEINYPQVLNAVLPPEIRVWGWAPVHEDFSARFTCSQRTYKYFFPRGKLNLHVMRDAASRLVGEHDFRNLCRMDLNGGVTNFVRRILRAEIEEPAPTGADEYDFCCDFRADEYDLCVLTVVGQAFLWHQIRCLVAVLFLVGEGHEQPEIIDSLLDVSQCPAKPQYSMAAELPLVLYDCEFPDLQWVTDQDVLARCIKTLQEKWCQHAVRSTVVRSMLSTMETAYSQCSGGAPDIAAQMDSLAPGCKSRVYIPLLKRPRTETLEARLEQRAKKQKTKVEPRDGPCDVTPDREGVTPASQSLCEDVTMAAASGDDSTPR